MLFASNFSTGCPKKPLAPFFVFTSVRVASQCQSVQTPQITWRLAPLSPSRDCDGIDWNWHFSMRLNFAVML